MFSLPEDIIPVIAAFAPLFSVRVWPQAQVLLLGAILTPGNVACGCACGHRRR